MSDLNSNKVAALKASFEELTGRASTLVAHAPGRVNLIGEHTDYNEGFVFPAAINFGTWAAAAPRDDRTIRAFALDYDSQENAFSLDAIGHDPSMPWSEYVRGVMKVLSQTYPHINGADLVITGNVPQGAGLSSSASLEIALLSAMTRLYALPVTGVEAALIGQKAENTFVGCSCGIMDQLISAMGKANEAMLLDCRSLTFTHSQIPDTHEIMIINSNVKRELVGSEYNVRRQQCEQAAAILNVTSLRHATLTQLEAAKSTMPREVYRRARHILTENARTTEMCEALNRGDIVSVSQAMAESHASMRDDFEITVAPIDYLVELVAGVVGERGGARMTGGGFGGCVVALVPHNQVKKVKESVLQHYPAKTGLTPDIYTCEATDGAFVR